MKNIFKSRLALLAIPIVLGLGIASSPSLSAASRVIYNPLLRGTTTIYGSLASSSATLSGTWAGTPTFSGNITLSGTGLKLTGYTQANIVKLGSISATATHITFVAPRNVTITGKKLTCATDVTADDTNYWTYSSVNKGSTDGTGSTALLLATDVNTTKATGGSAMSDYVARSLSLTATTANLDISAGDIITDTLTKTASATTMADCTMTTLYKDR